MISKKYRDDYQLEYERGPNGRLRETASYIGGYYGFVRALPVLKRNGILLAAAAGGLLLIQLWFTDLYGAELRTLVLPVALSFPAFGYYCVVLSRLVGLKENKMTHRQRDLICDRLPVGAMLFLILSGLAFLASVWGAIAIGATPGRLLYAADALAQTALAVLLFRGRKSLTTERL